jgi:hypothetical protein
MNLMPDRSYLILLIIVFFIGLVIGIIILRQFLKWFTRWRLIKQGRIARSAETEAEQFLIDLGYKIVGRQCRAPLEVYMDGCKIEAYVQADLLVEKDKKVFVAEVKSGQEAVRITNSGTRRQLLEYYVTYRPEGILLVDMFNRKVHLVEFKI